MLLAWWGGGALSLFSPAGRRWPEGPDEGAVRSEFAERPLIASHALGTSPRWGEEASRNPSIPVRRAERKERPVGAAFVDGAGEGGAGEQAGAVGADIREASPAIGWTQSA